MIALIIGLILTAWVMIQPRWWSLYFPFWYAFFPKGFVLLDNPGIPVVTMYRALCLALLVSVSARAIYKREHWMTSSPIFLPMFIILISCLLSAGLNINSPNVGLMKVFNFFNEIIVPVSAFSYYFSKESDEFQQSLFRKLFLFYGIIALYGAITFLVGYNPYIEFLKTTTQTGRVVVQTYEGSLRGVRAQGTISHPITFGACVGIILLACFSIGNAKRWLGRSPTRGILGIAAALAIAAAVMFTKSRSPLILLGVAVICTVMLSTLWRTYIYLVFGSVACVLAFLFIPEVQSSALSVANIFVSSIGEDQKGSSLDMRTLQMEVAKKYLFVSPLFGNGMDATENIVASGTEPNLFDSESLLYSLMIDQGFFGILSYLVFFSWIFILTLTNIKDRNSWAVFSGLIIGYITFVIATGVMETLSLFCCMVSAILLRWRKVIFQR
jgi:hypothetical protein